MEGERFARLTGERKSKPSKTELLRRAFAR